MEVISHPRYFFTFVFIFIYFTYLLIVFILGLRAITEERVLFWKKFSCCNISLQTKNSFRRGIEYQWFAGIKNEDQGGVILSE
jgi:hypothetical protein